jgi:hypothetical protein
MVLERWTYPKQSRRTCTCEYGLQSWRGESARVAKRPRERSLTRNPYRYDSQLLHRCMARRGSNLLGELLGRRPPPAPSEPVSVSTRRTGLHHEYAGGRWSPWCVQLTRTCQRWVLGHSRPPSRDFNASTTVSLKRFRAQRSNGLYCCEGRSILRLRAQLPVSAHSPPPGRLWAWGDLQRHRQAHISYMVLPVAPSEAARAPRLEMVPGEALMAGYAYNDSLKRYPNSFQWGVEQLQVRFEPHCSYIAPLCSFSVHSLPSAPECTECRRG